MIQLCQFFLQNGKLCGFLFAGVIDVVAEILAELIRLFFVPFLRLDGDDVFDRGGRLRVNAGVFLPIALILSDGFVFFRDRCVQLGDFAFEFFRTLKLLGSADAEDGIEISSRAIFGAESVTRFVDVIEKSEHLIKFLLRDRIVFVIMAACAS